MAFPAIGVPQHRPIGPEIERSVVYSVARTESAFDQRRRVRRQKAVGLMQVTPEAGRDTAKKVRCHLRLGSDGFRSSLQTRRWARAELAALFTGVSWLPHHDLRRL